MDLPAPADQPGVDPPPEPVLLVDGPPPEPPEPPASPGREPTLAARAAPSEREILATLQDEVAALNQQVEALAGSFETVVRAAVAEEMQRVAGELQHTVATLGRVLVRDLGRLNQILAQHRDAILAELRPTAGGEEAESTAEPSPSPAENEEAGAKAAPDAASTASDAEKGRNWRRRKA